MRESPVLVTSLDPAAFPTIVMPKHYRDRADAEWSGATGGEYQNCFGELKNQWGWGGSRKLASSRLMANLIAFQHHGNPVRFRNIWTQKIED